jgi:propionyl-CoA carboxylase alpha chain
MIRAIDEYEITGLETTLGFCRFVMEHDAFRSGNFDTRFVENHFSPNKLFATAGNVEEKIASAMATLLMSETPVKQQNHHSRTTSKWKKSRSE